MAPTYAGGYPIVNSTVVPVGQAPMATPMMVMPGYAPACVPVPVYNQPNPATSNPTAASRPKPLTEEVIINKIPFRSKLHFSGNYYRKLKKFRACSRLSIVKSFKV